MNTDIYTPNIDGLAKQSIICTRAYVQSPQCQPSRASIWTGRYPTAHRVWWNGIDLNKSELTIADYLRGEGYETAYFGKMHLGSQSDYGFTTKYLFEHWQQETQRNKTIKNEFYDVMKKPTWTGNSITEKIHHDDVIVDRALMFLENHKSKYFAVVSFNGPHPPYLSPERFNSRYKSKFDNISGVPNLNDHTMTDADWNLLKQQYYGCVSWIDHNVGRILNSISDDTIVIYMSDHGDMLGDHGLFSKGLYMYEGVVRIPLLLRLPQYGDMRYYDLVESVDIVPTLLEYLNIPINPRIQGKSLMKSFRENSQAHRSICSMIGYEQRIRMVRTNNFKYCQCGDQEVLFNLNADPGETNNIVLDNPEFLSNMRFELIKKLVQCEDPTPVPTAN